MHQSNRPTDDIQLNTHSLSPYYRYSIIEDFTELPNNPYNAPASNSAAASSGNTTPSPSSATLTATPQPVNIIYSNQLGGSSFSSTYGGAASSSNSVNAPPPTAINQFSTNSNSSAKPVSRKGGVIFPSIKNKPSVVNTTFATDLITLKDVKVSHCWFDLLASQYSRLVGHSLGTEPGLVLLQSRGDQSRMHSFIVCCCWLATFCNYVRRPESPLQIRKQFPWTPTFHRTSPKQSPRIRIIQRTPTNSQNPYATQLLTSLITRIAIKCK